jgi:transcriptional regulator with PAS, ATPase and Fis domain
LLQGLPATPGRRFDEIYCTTLPELLLGAHNGGRQRLEDRTGSVFAAKVEAVLPPRPVAAIPRPAPSRVDFVAEDAAVQHVLRQIEAAAPRKLPILVKGASGTGKEQLARYAHKVSFRRGAFVPVNCASLPESLVEAELFGHAEGAFTGARRGGAPGLVAEADGGTLFLDEIGDMKPPLQAVLLRLLDDWTLRPVGGGRARCVDVLLVAATNVDLDAAVAAGRFRADLLYRINTVDVTLPPLAQRSDFAAIANWLLAAIAPGAKLTPEAVAKLVQRPWRGNMRELRAELTRLTLTDPTRVIAAGDVSDDAGAITPVMEANGRSLRGLLADRVRSVHREVDGNVAETARRLRVSRNTVYRALLPRVG